MKMGTSHESKELRLIKIYRFSFVYDGNKEVSLFKILQVKQNAIALAEVMKGEDGVEGAVAAFHKHLPHIMPTATELKAPKRPSNSFYGHLSCCF